VYLASHWRGACLPFITRAESGFGDWLVIKGVLLFVVIGIAALALRPLGGVASRVLLQPPAPLEDRGKVTMLVLGIDRRTTEPTRTDTMLLARVGPAGQATEVLSIPRDLWVAIPGHGEDRINTAFVWGGLANGDGAGLARRTVEETFGVQVDRVMVVDFACFQEAVDAVGGVSVNVPQRLVDDSYPMADGGTTTIAFEPGAQRLSGERALEYVRTREADNDFGRIGRQQQVVAAVAARLADPGAAMRMTTLWIGGCGHSGTDLSPTDVAALGRLAVAGGQPHFATVGLDMVVPTTLASGAEVLMPRWDRIRPLVAQTFGNARG
jgi:LCP family protein required for cell wall assembly